MLRTLRPGGYLALADWNSRDLRAYPPSFLEKLVLKQLIEQWVHPKIISINSQAISSLNIMKKNNISQLLVVDDSKKYVGIIHFHNIMKEGLNNE